MAEQVLCVVWAGGGFGVVLNGEERVRLVGEAFEALIIQIDVSRGRAHLRQRGFVDCEAVILAGDFDLPGGEVAYRVVDAVMTELELANVGLQRAGDQLMPEANAEHRQLAD